MNHNLFSTSRDSSLTKVVWRITRDAEIWPGHAVDESPVQKAATPLHLRGRDRHNSHWRCFWLEQEEKREETKEDAWRKKYEGRRRRRGDWGGTFSRRNKYYFNVPLIYPVFGPWVSKAGNHPSSSPLSPPPLPVRLGYIVCWGERSLSCNLYCQAAVLDACSSCQIRTVIVCVRAWDRS